MSDHQKAVHVGEDKPDLARTIERELCARYPVVLSETGADG